MTRSYRWCAAWALGMMSVWSAGSAGAQQLGPLALGVKLGAGGNMLLEPDDKASVPVGAFDDGVGGYGITGGFYAELRLLDGLLAVESGLMFDTVNNWSQLDLFGVEYELGWTSNSLRIPLLVSVGTPGSGTRVSLGTGFELVLPLGASQQFSVERGSGGAGGSLLTGAETETQGNWLVNLGLASPVGPLRLSFDVRFALNLSPPSNYADRYDSGTVLAEHGMDLRLLLGLAYELELGQ